MNRDQRAFDRWLTTEPEPPCPFEDPECTEDTPCAKCVNELALQDDYDASQESR